MTLKELFAFRRFLRFLCAIWIACAFPLTIMYATKEHDVWGWCGWAAYIGLSVFQFFMLFLLTKDAIEYRESQAEAQK